MILCEVSEVNSFLLDLFFLVLVTKECVLLVKHQNSRRINHEKFKFPSVSLRFSFRKLPEMFSLSSGR